MASEVIEEQQVMEKRAFTDLYEHPDFYGVDDLLS